MTTHTRRRHVLRTSICLGMAVVVFAMLTGCISEVLGQPVLITPDMLATAVAAGIAKEFDPERRAREQRERARRVANKTAMALRNYAQDHGRWPAHPAQLVAQGYLRYEDLRVPGSPAPFSDTPVGSTNLGMLPHLSKEKREQVTGEAVEALPDHPLAMRLGDLVFTYFGAPYIDEVKTIWLVIVVPHPDIRGREGFCCARYPESSRLYPIMDADHLLDLEVTEFPDRLRAQNAFRAKVGLPPLPDPRSIPNDGRVVAASSPAEVDEWWLGRHEHGLWPGDMSQQKAQAVTAALERYALGHGGRGPAHAAALVAEGYLDPSALIGRGSATDPSRVPVGHATLGALPGLTPKERRQAVQEAADSLPDGVVAHRLGDFVFTHHGIDFGNRRSRLLWVAFLAPDPQFNGPVESRDWVWGCAPGNASAAGLPHFKVLGRLGNHRRAEVGLAPLPDPAVVTHDAPAVATAAN